MSDHARSFRLVKVEIWQGQVSAVAAASFRFGIMSADLSLCLLPICWDVGSEDIIAMSFEPDDTWTDALIETMRLCCTMRLQSYHCLQTGPTIGHHRQSMLRGFLSPHQLDQECDLGTGTIGRPPSL